MHKPEPKKYIKTGGQSKLVLPKQLIFFLQHQWFWTSWITQILSSPLFLTRLHRQPGSSTKHHFIQSTSPTVPHSWTKTPAASWAAASSWFVWGEASQAELVLKKSQSPSFLNNWAFKDSTISDFLWKVKKKSKDLHVIWLLLLTLFKNKISLIQMF